MSPLAPVPPLILYAHLYGNCWLLKPTLHRHKQHTHTHTLSMDTNPCCILHWQVIYAAGKSGKAFSGFVFLLQITRIFKFVKKAILSNLVRHWVDQSSLIMPLVSVENILSCTDRERMQHSELIPAPADHFSCVRYKKTSLTDYKIILWTWYLPNASRQSLQIWHKSSSGLKDERIRFWQSEVAASSLST